MIYTSFIYLLIAIALFSGAQAGDSLFLPLSGDFVMISFLYLFFVLIVRLQLRWVRVSGKESLEVNFDARQQRARLFTRFRLLSIILFAASLYFFDLKALILLLPGTAGLEVLQNFLGIAAFVLYWCIIWYWEFHEGDAPGGMATAGEYIRGQIGFQFGVFVPWLLLSLILDILLLLKVPRVELWMDSPLFQLVFYSVFFLLLIVFSPAIMIRLWNCHPLAEDKLKTDIEDLCRVHKVSFKAILSWDALGGGLITAGVIGLFPAYRYLLITPRLIRLLNREELLAVTAHEIAHIKKRHMLHYFVFVLGFVLVSMGAIQHLVLLFFNTEWGQALIINSRGELRSDLISFIYIFVSLYFLVIYFRFVFGYFMRHFERQADLFPIAAGMPPGPLLSAFEKLARVTGDDGSRRNWHHFTLPERMTAIEAAAADPRFIRRHDRSLRRSLLIFWSMMILLSVILYSPFAKGTAQAQDLEVYARILEKQLQADPKNPQMLLNLAAVYHEMKRWREAESAYLEVIRLAPSQATALNNLSWLYLTCEDETLRDPVRALPLAEAAVKIDYSPTTIDTLAEACYQNERFETAYKLSREAFRLAEQDEDDHLARQLKKMEEAWKKNRRLEDVKSDIVTI